MEARELHKTVQETAPELKVRQAQAEPAFHGAKRATLKCATGNAGMKERGPRESATDKGAGLKASLLL